MYFKPVILLKDPNIVSHVYRYIPVIPGMYQKFFQVLHQKFWCKDDARIFMCSGFLGPLWEGKHRQTPAAEVKKILFAEKRNYAGGM
jgi:hypothetical protein